MVTLLKEYYELRPEKEVLKELKEADLRGEPLIIKGILQRANAKNQNDRIYPKEILEKEVDRYLKEFVERGIAYGELDHAESPVIELQKCSHKVKNLWWEGDDVMGEVQLLDTPCGRIAKTIVLDGPLGISSRAVGSVSKNEAKGADVVQDDLQLICFDLVGIPSTEQAFLQLREGKEIKDFNPRKILPPEVRIRETLRELLGK